MIAKKNYAMLKLNKNIIFWSFVMAELQPIYLEMWQKLNKFQCRKFIKENRLELRFKNKKYLESQKVLRSGLICWM